MGEDWVLWLFLVGVAAIVWRIMKREDDEKRAEKEWQIEATAQARELFVPLRPTLEAKGHTFRVKPIFSIWDCENEQCSLSVEVVALDGKLALSVRGDPDSTCPSA